MVQQNFDKSKNILKMRRKESDLKRRKNGER